MKNYSGWTITTHHNDGNLADIDPDDYRDRCQEALEAAFPGATINVIMHRNCSGTEQDTTAFLDGCNDYRVERDMVDQVDFVQEPIFEKMCAEG